MKKNGYLKGLAVLILCALIMLTCLIACDEHSDGGEGKGEQSGQGGDGNASDNGDGSEDEDDVGNGGASDGDGSTEDGKDGNGLPTVEFPIIPFD